MNELDLTKHDLIPLLFVMGVVLITFLLIQLLDHMNPVKRDRMGFDVSWIVIIVMVLCVIIAGVLKKNGVL